MDQLWSLPEKIDETKQSDMIFLLSIFFCVALATLNMHGLHTPCTKYAWKDREQRAGEEIMKLFYSADYHVFDCRLLEKEGNSLSHFLFLFQFRLRTISTTNVGGAQFQIDFF